MYDWNNSTMDLALTGNDQAAVCDRDVCRRNQHADEDGDLHELS